jgi:hypothetical protein
MLGLGLAAIPDGVVFANVRVAQQQLEKILSEAKPPERFPDGIKTCWLNTGMAKFHVSME